MAESNNKQQMSRYQRQLKGRQGQSAVRIQGQLERRVTGTRESRDRAKIRMDGDAIDEKFGFQRLTEGLPRDGWLLNYLPTTMPNEAGIEKSGLDLYFIDGTDGSNFKASIFYEPYFYIDVSDPRRLIEIGNQLLRKFEGCRVEQIEKEDLDLPNHLSGKKHPFLKVLFGTVSDLMEAKSVLRPIIQDNQKRLASSSDYFFGGDGIAAGLDIWDDGPSTSKTPGLSDKLGEGGGINGLMALASDPLAYIIELREYDVPYAMRAAIDMDIRVGAWYSVTPTHGSETCDITWLRDRMERCEPRILAFDIECEKSPLKFPNADTDRIYMISYMQEGKGYLIINREVVSEDVEDFEYSPKPKFTGPFQVFNVANEEELIKKFIDHIQELRPHVFVTYNGDRFDWPYIESRCSKYQYLSLYSQLGMKCTTPKRADGVVDGEYIGRCIVHLDAFSWVQRDSYLPQGSQGLKAVTKAKLGYEPVEIDPEDMLRFAQERPTYMAQYSVSDAVATYYLYTTYVHNFIFSLSTIIPMGGEDVLRKGSGTLCEALLMVEAYKCNIICPNKQADQVEAFYEGHLLESETYIGGHVECLEAGVFRADIPEKFNLVPSALQQLIDNIDRDLTFTLEVEHGIERSDVCNYDDVRQAIIEKLEMLRDAPQREEPPIIYHLDVGAMYPNIILTNRLQPSAMVSTSDCASCVHNRSENNCKRPMKWTWRGDYSPAGISEYQAIKRQLTYERFASKDGPRQKVGAGEATTHNEDGAEITEDGAPPTSMLNRKGYNSSAANQRSFNDLPEREQMAMIKSRLKAYSHRVYQKTKVTKEEERINTVCMRENSFYVDTVRAFRDRRYDYKLLTKKWKKKKVEADSKGDSAARKAAEDKEVLMDSLQLAHKCILNSFYGYVMRKGARWRSMEMAGIVTHTGAQLITQARELVEQVGRPLELDTDGIWCILPSSFPQDFKFQTISSGTVNVGYPCAMLNADVHERYTNHQYQDEIEVNVAGKKVKKFSSHSECSIFFELDGPYKAMILPASPEEGKLLKKKYVVFNFDGTLAELKGFELKRRGELGLVKIFQSQVFEHFLGGQSLSECYKAVGAVANRWLDILDNEGHNTSDEELLELISERKTISKTIEDYEGRKSTSLTTAARLADFLGAEMVKDRGLNCNLIITRLPAGAPVTERALPVAIFSSEPAVRRYFMRKWLKDPSLDCEDFRDVVDWDYYKDRLGKSVQKIITIPAGMQGVDNPCPRVEHPVWLQRKVNERTSGKKQLSILASMARMKLASPSGKDSACQSDPSAILPQILTDTHQKISAKSLGAADLINEISSDVGGTSRSKKRVRIMIGEEIHEIGSNQTSQREPVVADLEDIAGSARSATDSAIKSALGAKVTIYKSNENFAVGADSSNGNEASSTELESEDNSICDAMTVMALNEHAPETDKELQAWLRARKEQWKQMRSSRRQRKAALQASSNRSYAITPGIQKRHVGVIDFVRSASLAAAYGFWQVLELQETETLGEFTVWAITQRSQLQRLVINIDRQFFVNINHNGTDAQLAAVNLRGTKVRRDLPHGKQCRELFELFISERKFQRNERALNRFLCDAQVEGVYETQVPLWFRGILRMGCVAKVGQHAVRDHLTSYKLRDIELVHVNSHPYLAPQVSNFRRIYIFFASDTSRSSGDLGILGLFCIETTNADDLEIYREKIQHEFYSAVRSGSPEQVTNAPASIPLCARAEVWLVNSRANGALDSKPPLQRIFRKFQADPAAKVKFTQSFVSSTKDAFHMCSESLIQYERERHGPTIVIAQGSNPQRTATNSSTTADIYVGMNNKQWRQYIPALKDFPLAVMPANSLDQSFPAVGWQLFAAERMVQRYLLFPRWFEDRLNCARYSHIPVCNLGPDALTTMIDVIFSRQLHHNRHLLWASEGAKNPDVGQGVDSEPELLDVWSESLSEPIINTEGMYRDICVELDLYGLAICAIMSSSELDAEGLTAMSINSNTGPDTGIPSSASNDGGSSAAHFMMEGVSSSESMTDASCARAFNIFKAMVAKCIDDVSRKANTEDDSSSGRISDSILTAIYRYLCGYGNGMLTDPLLHRVIYGLMTKLFQKLVGGLRRLGTKVVHANFSRIIISTGKYDLGAAIEYAEFILAAIAHKSTFAFLQVSIKSTWEQLCWLDPENWSGIPLQEVRASLDTELSETAGGAVGDETEPHVDEVATPLDASIETESSKASDTQSTTPSKSDKQANNSKYPSPVSVTVVPGDDDDVLDEDVASMDIRPRELPQRTAPTEEEKKNNPILAALWKNAPRSAAVTPSTREKVNRSDSNIPNTAVAENEMEEDELEGGDDFDFLDDDVNGSYGQSVSIADIKNQYRGDRRKMIGSRRKSSREAKRYAAYDLENDEEEDLLWEESDGDSDEAYSDDDDSQKEDTNHYTDGSNLQGHWNIASYLPATAAEYFHFIIGEYMRQYKTKREQLCHLRDVGMESFEYTSAAGSFGNHADTDNITQQGVMVDENSIIDAATDFMRKLIQQRFTSKMLEIVDELLELAHHHQHMLLQHNHHQHHHRHPEPERSLFPQRAGSYLPLSSPALEFVKATTHVLMLDSSLTSEVSALRRLLLTQLKVREFSSTSTYQDPSLSYILRDVICSYCSTCRDFDLLRDESLTAKQAVDRWRCEHCGNRLNTEEIENRLLEEVDKLTASYLLQDFRCSKTHLVARRLSSATSDASKPLQMDVSQQSAKHSLMILRRVATFHNFTMLHRSVDELLVTND